MKLSTFTARSMAEALALVKHRLGADAVIVHTRQYKRGGLLGLGAKPVVEVTAAAAADWPAKSTRRPVPTRRTPVPARAVAMATPDPLPPPAAAMSAGDLIRHSYAAARAEFAGASAAFAPAPGGGAATLDRPASLDHAAIAGEMRAVKQLVTRVLHQQRSSAPPALPGKLFDQYVRLIEQEVAQELADEIVHEVGRELDESALHDDAQVRAAVQHRLAALIRADEQAGQLIPTDDGRPRTIALIGPTGVGKTTTLAKLAANFKLKQHKKVALITLDTYRIAAVDQLRTYASILGVPLHVATSPEQMLDALRACRGFDAILIDTAGRSQRDDPKLQQLRTYIQAANPHEVHLVLSLTSHQSVLLEAAERFSAIRTDRMIFTKLDEAVNFGVLVNVARQVSVRLSFIATGQEVPHDIEPTRPDRLARLVMGESI